MIEGFDLSIPGFKKLEDFVPFNESIIWQISHDYYKQKGFQAWSDTSPKIVPHKSGSNYQNALNIVKILKKLKQETHLSSKIKFLECGAGSGRFSRHLMLAARDEGFINDIELYLSDFSQKNLDDIKSRKILSDIDGIQEDVHYHYLLLDITQAQSNLKFDFIFLHFVFDALKLTVLKKNSNQELEELYISSSLREDIQFSVLENIFLQARIQRDFQWREYDITKRSELEKKFFPQLNEFIKNNSSGQEIFYIYSALEAIQNLFALLEPHGILFSSDIRPNQGLNQPIVGNSLAFEIDNEFLVKAISNGYSFIMGDDKLSRLILSPSKQVIESFSQDFENLYGPNNSIQQYIELESLVSHQVEQKNFYQLQENIEKLFKLAPYNASSLALIAKAYDILGDKTKAQEFSHLANSMNYWLDIP
jgi:2-polyprenyl-3-methyl-5-hydroxy-6-metoxy-1,4-benzoquinol methylase